MGFPGVSDGKEITCSVGDLVLIPGSGRSSGERNGYLLQHSCLENSMDRGAWRATTQSWRDWAANTHRYIHTYIHIYTDISYWLSSLENPDWRHTPSPPACPRVAAEKVSEGARTFTPQGGKQPLSMVSVERTRKAWPHRYLGTASFTSCSPLRL